MPFGLAAATGGVYLGSKYMHELAAGDQMKVRITKDLDSLVVFVRSFSASFNFSRSPRRVYLAGLVSASARALRLLRISALSLSMFWGERVSSKIVLT